MAMAMDAMARAMNGVFPEKVSRQAAEIALLMREGGPKGREKARELLRETMDGRSADAAPVPYPTDRHCTADRAPGMGLAPGMRDES